MSSKGGDRGLGTPQWPLNGALMVLNSGYLVYVRGWLGGLGTGAPFEGFGVRALRL